MLAALEATGLVKEVERVSAKYVNIIEAPEGREQFELIRFEAKLLDNRIPRKSYRDSHSACTTPDRSEYIRGAWRLSGTSPAAHCATSGSRQRGCTVCIVACFRGPVLQEGGWRISITMPDSPRTAARSDQLIKLCP